MQFNDEKYLNKRNVTLPVSVFSAIWTNELSHLGSKTTPPTKVDVLIYVGLQ